MTTQPLRMTRFQRQNLFAARAQREAKPRNCAPFATRRQLKQLVDISGLTRPKKIFKWLRAMKQLAPVVSFA